MLWYVPLEPYVERYTAQLSAPVTGWMERNWRAANIPYHRIGYGSEYTQPIHIDDGVVLDATQRGKHALEQSRVLLQLISWGDIKPTDTIYFDDFWHPGIEAIAYYGASARKKLPRMYSFCFAQSIDRFDFTAKFGSWMKTMERAYSKIYDGVFVASSMLRDLYAKEYETQFVYQVGLPFSVDEVKSRMNFDEGEEIDRKHQVVFSSRWDEEKQPGVFIQIAKRVLAHDKDVKFVICSSSPTIRSNNQNLIMKLNEFKDQYPNNVEVRPGLTKEEYYDILLESKIQINTSLQDWVSYTLLEALCAGCVPIYPNFRSFPEVFQGYEKYLYGEPRHFCAGNYPGQVYDRKAVDAAAELVLGILDSDNAWTDFNIEDRLNIARPHDQAWRTMAEIMGVQTWRTDGHG